MFYVLTHPYPRVRENCREAVYPPMPSADTCGIMLNV